jgi:hypothetical protein
MEDAGRPRSKANTEDAAAAQQEANRAEPPIGALSELPADVEKLIDAYEVELECGHCKTSFKRPVAWLRHHNLMSCPGCSATIVLGTSVINEEIRHVAKQMRALQQQLHEVMRRAAGLLGK